MKLIRSVTPQEFMKAINACEGTVWMTNNDGDRLNLKSQLCQYIFVTILMQPELVSVCWLECKDAKDVKYLQTYMEQPESVRYSAGVQ